MSEETEKQELIAEETATPELTAEEAEKQALIEKNRKFLAHFPAFGKFLLIYAGNFIIPEIFYIVFDSTFLEGNMTLNILATLAGMIVYFVILTRVFTKKSDDGIIDILQAYPRQQSAKVYLQLFLLGISLNLAMSSLIALIPFPKEWVESYTSSTSSVMNTDGLVISLVYVALIAPLFEEIFFRGFMYRTLRGAFGMWSTTAILAVGFGIPHLHPLWVGMAVCAGFVFTLLRERFHNITVSYVLHTSYNLVAIPMLLTQGTDLYTALFDNPVIEIIYLLGGGAVIFFCMKALLREAKEAEQPPEPIKFEIHHTPKGTEQDE